MISSVQEKKKLSVENSQDIVRFQIIIWLLTRWNLSRETSTKFQGKVLMSTNFLHSISIHSISAGLPEAVGGGVPTATLGIPRSSGSSFLGFDPPSSSPPSSSERSTRTSFFLSSASFSFLNRSASSSLGTGFQDPSWFKMISFSSSGNSSALITSWKYPSKMRSSYFAGPSQTGQVHVGFFSFIIKNREASKHWRWSQVVGLHGIDILILPSGQLTVTFKLVVAMPSSSSVSFFLISSLVNSGCLFPLRVSLSSNCSLESFSTSHMPTTQPLP